MVPVLKVQLSGAQSGLFDKQCQCLCFRSIGSQNDSTMLHKRIDGEEDPQVLRGELKRLEAKALALTSTFEHHEKGIRELNEVDLEKLAIDCEARKRGIWP